MTLVDAAPAVAEENAVSTVYSYTHRKRVLQRFDSNCSERSGDLELLLGTVTSTLGRVEEGNVSSRGAVVDSKPAVRCAAAVVPPRSLSRGRDDIAAPGASDDVVPAPVVPPATEPFRPGEVDRTTFRPPARVGGSAGGSSSSTAGAACLTRASTSSTTSSSIGRTAPSSAQEHSAHHSGGAGLDRDLPRRATDADRLRRAERARRRALKRERLQAAIQGGRNYVAAARRGSPRANDADSTETVIFGEELGGRRKKPPPLFGAPKSLGVLFPDHCERRKQGVAEAFTVLSDRFIPSRAATDLDSGFSLIEERRRAADSSQPYQSLLRSELLPLTDRSGFGPTCAGAAGGGFAGGAVGSLDDDAFFGAGAAGYAGNPFLRGSTTTALLDLLPGSSTLRPYLLSAGAGGTDLPLTGHSGWGPGSHGSYPLSASSSPTVGGGGKDAVNLFRFRSRPVAAEGDCFANLVERDGEIARPAPRKIAKVPFKVLDAPQLQDDFYLNLVDWSASNCLSVGLASCVGCGT